MTMTIASFITSPPSRINNSDQAILDKNSTLIFFSVINLLWHSPINFMKDIYHIGHALFINHILQQINKFAINEVFIYSANNILVGIIAYW